MSKEEFFAEAERRRMQYASVAGLHLLLCPFCGGKAELRIIMKTWTVECMTWETCNTIGPSRNTPDTAALAWNMRPRELAYRKALVGLVGTEDPAELRAMAEVLHLLPANSEEKATMGYALQVLVGEKP